MLGALRLNGVATTPASSCTPQISISSPFASVPKSSLNITLLPAPIVFPVIDGTLTLAVILVQAVGVVD